MPGQTAQPVPNSTVVMVRRTASLCHSGSVARHSEQQLPPQQGWGNQQRGQLPAVPAIRALLCSPRAP